MQSKYMIEKIIVGSGIGKMRQQSQFEEKILPEIAKEMALITGQNPSFCPAKKSVAGFKIREGEIVGLKVTLRGKRMLDFLNRLINTALPRVKDFQGVDLKGVDEEGSLNIGLKEQYPFPEIEPEKSRTNFGLQITIVPRLRGRQEAIDLYKKLKIPLREKEENG